MKWMAMGNTIDLSGKGVYRDFRVARIRIRCAFPILGLAFLG